MSIKVTNWVWANSQSRNGARLVMLAIADRADDDGIAWPSIEDLAERTRLSPRAVQKGIAALLKDGELKVEAGGGRGRSNRYRIIPKPRTNDGVTGEEPRTFDGVTAPETPNFAPETPNSATRNPELCDVNPVESAGEPSEPPEEPSRNRHPRRAPASTPPASAADADALRAAQPLIDEMTRRGMRISWQMQAADWRDLVALIHAHGAPVLADHAERVWHAAKTPPYSARYFLPGWRGLPAVPADTERPPLRAVRGGGHQPFQPPADPSVYQNGFANARTDAPRG